jgi:uncharacterized protein YggL (DUF469 family)
MAFTSKDKRYQRKTIDSVLEKNNLEYAGKFFTFTSLECKITLCKNSDHQQVNSWLKFGHPSWSMAFPLLLSLFSLKNQSSKVKI